MKILVVPISQVKAYRRNPRKPGKAVAKVADSIREFGFRQPIVVDEAMEIIAGHTRLLAAIHIGLTEVPVHVATGLTATQVKAYRLADNRAAQEAEWDEDLLRLEIGDLEAEGFDLALTGFDQKELDGLVLGGDVVEDVAPTPPEAPKSVVGQVYELGPHRVLCGDATGDGPTSAGFRPDIYNVVFTDPPYGVDYVSRVDEARRKPWGGITNDDLGDKELFGLLRGAVPEAEFRFVCCDWHCYSLFEAALGRPKAVCVWDKGHFGLGKGYRRQHEFVLFYGTLNRTDLSDVWRFDRPANYLHPTQKPIGLIAKALADVSARRVYDPFAGGGSTLIAAEQLGLVCDCVEVEPRWVDVIRQRYANFVKDPQYSPAGVLSG